MADDVGAFDVFPENIRSKLAPLRQLVLSVAASNPAIGPLAESLKWGEPSFTPLKKGVGSSVRIATRKDGMVALNFICHTGLVDRFREIYRETLVFEGNRTIVVDLSRQLPEPELRHCVAMALTYFMQRWPPKLFPVAPNVM
jgi:hypothetical protein